MAITLVVHLTDQDPVVCEVDEMPDFQDQIIKVSNPRLLDGKDLHYLAAGVVEVLWPIHRINFIEIMPMDEEEIIGFVRE
jgi:hypothetical protein